MTLPGASAAGSLLNNRIDLCCHATDDGLEERDMLRKALRFIKARRYKVLSRPILRHLRMLGLRRVTPLPSRAGAYRGTQIPRRFFDTWIHSQIPYIQGHVAELGGSGYARLGSHQVSKIDVIDLDTGNPELTIAADLTRADSIPDCSFDCLIVPFTFHILYDLKSALAHSIRILKPGGVLLANFESFGYIPQEAPAAFREWKVYWRFTPAFVRRLLEEFVRPENIDLTLRGNILTVSAAGMGLAAEELTPGELAFCDERFAASYVRLTRP